MSDQQTETSIQEDSPVLTKIMSGDAFTVSGLGDEVGLDKRALWAILTKLRGEGHIFQERPTGFKNQKELRYGGKGEPKAKAPAKPRGRPKKTASAPSNNNTPSTPRRHLPMPGDTITAQVTSLRLAQDKSLEAVLAVGKDNWVVKLLEPSAS